jgi:amidohydrolase
MRPSTDDGLLAELLAAIELELPQAVALRQRLHAEPELAHAEHRTAELVAGELEVPCERVAGTGLVAHVGTSDTAAVAVRAELDGLPIREQTGAPFSASGETMHACGHDVHMAALVALTRAARGLAERLPAPLLALFQPSEEAYPSGAQELAQGPLAQIALAAIVGAHVHPELRWGEVALDAGIVNASCDAVLITVEGEPSHGGYPHLGRDPILALSQVIVALHAQVGRSIDPLHPATLTVGVIEAGTAENVIPRRASARGALRAYSAEDRETLRAMVREIVTGVAAGHGCRGSVTLDAGEPALENDARIVTEARALLSHADLRPANEWRSCGSDDFAFFGNLAPLAMAFVGLDGADGFRRRPLHHPELLVPDEAVRVVARTQAVLYAASAQLAEHRRRGSHRRSETPI